MWVSLLILLLIWGSGSGGNRAVQIPHMSQKFGFLGNDDGRGRRSRMALWNHPGDDVTGAIARVPRVRETMERLLGGPVYHYHSKLMMKDHCFLVDPGWGWSW